MTASEPTLWIIAGPNGVGKTTYAFRHIRSVSGSVHFVNLDEIARGLSPLAPDAARTAAARVALDRMHELIAARVSFSIETLSGRTHLRTIAAAKAAVLGVNLLFFTVADVATCLTRIARRVAEGGHDVPEADVIRRFDRAHANFPDYAAASDLWRVFDNNGAKPRVIAEGTGGLATMRGIGSAALPPRLADALATLPSR